MINMTTKIKRPKHFYHYEEMWLIKYVEEVSDDDGETFFSDKLVKIYTKGRDEQFIKDTLLHEIEHVLCNDLFDTLQKMTCDAEEKEEQFIRLITPRRLRLYSSNFDIINYLFRGNE